MQEFDLKSFIDNLKNETPEQIKEREKRYQEYQALQSKEQEEIKRNAIAEKFGKRFVDCTFDNYKTDNDKQVAVKQACIDYLHLPKSKGESLMLFGKSGTGKNHLVTAMLRDNYRVVEVIRLEYLNAEKMSIQKSGGNWMYKFKKYCYCDYLVIADLVIRGDGLSDSVKEMLLYIIDERYNNCKPVIICTNVDVKSLKSAIDFDSTERVSDRLREMVGNRVYCMDWESYRG